MDEKTSEIEQAACFYLGREYDLASKSVRTDLPPVLYDARDLLTHGVVVGMTGSGKTGLCISLLEEAAIDGISCIIIDIKGDLCNLLLQFPELKAEDFQRWLNPEDARIKKMTIEEYAQQLADAWRQGLADSIQSPDRIRLLQQTADFAVYTPGSDAGLPLAILKTFAAPPPGLPREEFAQRIDATVTALLGLTGISSDPVQSREHVFIAQLLLHAWNHGEDLDLAQLISRIQAPPLRTIGAFDVETFFPEKERLKLALALNNLLASPSFATWIEGDPLDLSVLLPPDRPRQIIFYLAHLEDAQRMFFLSLLLSEIVSWTRKQPGSSSLRTIVYLDEVFGYLPPHPANPPTKLPLLTLLKQARAFGVGVLLATQNPVDLDYKALSNAGTWIVGKLQTERDKARLIDGLEGVAAERGTLSDRAYLDNVISSLGNRVFLLHDVHRPKPVLLQTRWAMSFLRGPMTREQIAELMAEKKKQRAERSATVAVPQSARAEDHQFRDQLRRTTAIRESAATHVRPIVAPGIEQYFLPLTLLPAPPSRDGNDQPPRRTLIYRAALLAMAEVDFVNRSRGIEYTRPYRLLIDDFSSDEYPLWSAGIAIGSGLAEQPEKDAEWGQVPESLSQPKKLTALKKSFVEYLYANARLALYECPKLDLLSRIGEDVTSFLARCRSVAEARAAEEILRAEKQYLAEREPLALKLPAAPAPPSPATLWDLPVLNWFKPRSSKIILGRGDRMSARKEEQLRAKLARLDAEWQQRQVELNRQWLAAAENYKEVVIAAQKNRIRVLRFGLAWVPYWRLTYPNGAIETLLAYVGEGARSLSPT
jgi:hypothetical protein